MSDEISKQCSVRRKRDLRVFFSKEVCKKTLSEGVSLQAESLLKPFIPHALTKFGFPRLLSYLYEIYPGS